jgi:phosphatidylglycerophosphate synthase
MTVLANGIVEKSRKFRNKIFDKPADLLVKLKVSPNMITFISLLCGIAAAYFLFQNYLLFFLFGLLHLFLDGLDGVVARKANKQTKLGIYLDLITDRLVNLALLIKISFFLADYYVIFVIMIFFMSQLNYFVSKMKCPIMFSRTAVVIILMFGALTGHIFVANVAYLTVGVIALYSLMLQFGYFFRLMRTKRS